MGDNFGKDYTEYAQGVMLFIQFARGSADNRGFIICQCKKCKNSSHHSLAGVVEHLYVDGIGTKYSQWVLHGKLFPQSVQFHGEENCTRGGSEINVDVGEENDESGEDMKETLADIGT